MASQIISRIPPHSTFIELFAGTAAVSRVKRPAGITILVEASRITAAALASTVDATRCQDPASIDWTMPPASSPRVVIVDGDAFDFLRSPSTQAALLDPATFLYADPPYLRSTRTRLLYDVELSTDQEHSALLALLDRLTCRLAISGYASSLYAALLPHWRCDTFTAGTRGGIRTESLWMNYPAGLPLHDPSHLGRDFRERERIRRQQRRWCRRLAAMPPAERQALRAALATLDEGRGV